MRVWHQSPVAEGIDAPVKRDQLATPHRAVDFSVSEPDPSKLIPRNDAVLPRGNRGDCRPASTRMSFLGPTRVNLSRVGHAPERSTKNVTRGSRRATTLRQPRNNSADAL